MAKFQDLFVANITQFINSEVATPSLPPQSTIEIEMEMEREIKEKQKVASEATGEKKKEKEKEKEKKKESKSEEEAEEELKKRVDEEDGADREEKGANGAEVWQSEQRRVQME